MRAKAIETCVKKLKLLVELSHVHVLRTDRGVRGSSAFLLSISNIVCIIYCIYYTNVKVKCNATVSAIRSEIL